MHGEGAFVVPGYPGYPGYVDMHVHVLNSPDPTPALDLHAGVGPADADLDPAVSVFAPCRTDPCLG